MDELTLQKIKDAIAKSTSISVVVGKNPSIDEMGAALSLFLLLKQAKKEVSVASPEPPLVEVSSLVGINKVQNRLGGGAAGDLVVSFPYTEGEIEKVSYTLENNFLNIIVKAGEKGLSFNEQDVKYTHGGGNVDLLVVVGTPKLTDLGDLIGGDSMRDAKILNIDNHAENQKFGDITLVNPQATSVSEIMAEIVISLGFRIDKDAAQNLFDGIMTATNDFQSETSSLAFEMAGLLMRQGATRGTMQPTTTAPSRLVQPTPVATSQPKPAKQWLDEVASKVQDDPQPAPMQQSQQKNASATGKAPLDWLSPKVYKGSDNLG